MRLAVTISFSRSSSLVIGFSFADCSGALSRSARPATSGQDALKVRCSQDEADGTERAELMGVDQHAALLDPEGVAHPPQHVAVGADIFADALITSEPITDEIGGHADQIALH